jgi:cathepsin F
MKFTLVVLCFAVATASSESELRDQFAQYKADFKKTYTDGHELRFINFKESLVRIKEGNADRKARGADETQGLTQFSDLSVAQFRKTYLTLKPRTAQEIDATPMYDSNKCLACERFPEVKDAKSTAGGFDWAAKGAVTPVKDQGQCGGCWAFGTTGDVEGVSFLKTGKLQSLSEQQLISCDKKPNDAGCNGGLQEHAFKYVIANGLTTESNYPYTSAKGRSGLCAKAKITAPIQKIASWAQVSKTSAGEALIKGNLTANGPLTIAMDAGPMQDYKSGVDHPINCKHGKGACGCTAMDLDHAILIVGYGTDTTSDGNTTAYWKIKNSWSTNFGEEGYYRVVAGDNMCGLAMDVVHSHE